MDTISVDVGYGATKNHKLQIFPSRVQKGGDMLLGSEVYYKGEKYGVGFGSNEVELNRINSEVPKICCLYSICNSTTNNEVTLITGLPIGQFGGQKHALRDSFLGEHDIVVGGKERRLKIVDVKVFPQGAGALYSKNIQGSAILVDIGARSVDIAHFEEQPDGRRALKNYTTLYCGMMPLYSKVIHEINSKYTLSLTTDDGERILRKGLFYNGKEQNLDFVKPIMRSHIQQLKDELALNYPIKTTPVYLCGGGAYLFNKALGYEVLENSQFANALGFYRMGVK